MLAIGIENQVPTRFEAAALCVLTTGVMIACAEGAMVGSLYGIMICLLGTVSNALMMTVSGRVMSEKLDVLRLTFYTSPVSCLVLLPFFYFKEVRARLMPKCFADAPDICSRPSNLLSTLVSCNPFLLCLSARFALWVLWRHA